MVDGEPDEELEAIRERKLERLKDRADEAGGAPDADASREAAGTTPEDPVPFEGGSLRDVAGEYDLTLVDFYADWCGPCRMLEPILERIASDGAAAVVKVDADVHRDACRSFGVRGLPTLILFEDGDPVERLVGAQSEDAIRGLLEQYR